VYVGNYIPTHLTISTGSSSDISSWQLHTDTSNDQYRIKLGCIEFMTVSIATTKPTTTAHVHNTAKNCLFCIQGAAMPGGGVACRPHSSSATICQSGPVGSSAAHMVRHSSSAPFMATWKRFSTRAALAMLICAPKRKASLDSTGSQLCNAALLQNPDPSGSETQVSRSRTSHAEEATGCGWVGRTKGSCGVWGGSGCGACRSGRSSESGGASRGSGCSKRRAHTHSRKRPGRWLKR
jgi:hypothetical protein